MFIDTVKINVRAGNGGKGCQSFYRDKYQRRGIPDGGDGGKGADIVVVADHNLLTLLDLQYHRHFFGQHGGHGSGNKKRGRGAPDVVIRVPVGTVIRDAASGSVLRDLDQDGLRVVVARGGAGGNGNMHLKEPEPGEPGEEKNLLLDLKLLADAGVIGFPNAGKSTLITAISNAHPKVAAYPFTTLAPVLGVVIAGDKRFVVADIPGLIPGASQGKGLGVKFLKHIERTRVLIHIIDMAATDGRDPAGDFKTINAELKSYSKDLAKKPQVICANKMDMPAARENLVNFKKKVKKPVIAISALEKTNLEELINAVAKKL